MPIIREVIGDIKEGPEKVMAFGINTVGLDDRHITEKVDALSPLTADDQNGVPVGTVIFGICSDTEKATLLLVCHELGEGGWENAPEAIKRGFDTVGSTILLQDEEIATVAIGTGKTGRNQGASWDAIRAAMEASKANLVLYWENEKQKAMVEKDPNPQRVISAKEESPVLDDTVEPIPIPDLPLGASFSALANCFEHPHHKMMGNTIEAILGDPENIVALFK